MSAIYSFGPNTTSISFPWPADVTGLERIMLSAQGDLQRVLSAFFARPITIAVEYVRTSAHVTSGLPAVPLSLPNSKAVASASPETPIVQTRQVHLQCAGKTVCTATSTVRMKSPLCAHLFLEEKFAIGQMFRKLERLPQFQLVSVGFGAADQETTSTEKESSKQQLWRKYTLALPEFECDILEEFPCRDMFVRGEEWLTGKQGGKEPSPKSYESGMGSDLAVSTPRSPAGLVLFFGVGFLLMLALEAFLFFTGRRSNC